ncbi:hypothetical protein TNCT_30551 [Trichonephila clavata]|uniref:Uncharacterized protein n=1 Tax=Trichonephila clavata TaxID=2740835 RepID=A0A8X6KV76_TRICU|nr:hypothetical protein TNCT_30551 [Trichonephila clavata]
MESYFDILHYQLCAHDVSLKILREKNMVTDAQISYSAFDMSDNNSEGLGLNNDGLGLNNDGLGLNNDGLGLNNDGLGLSNDGFKYCPA